MTKKVTLKLTEWGLFLVLGIVLGLLFRGFHFWVTLLIGFGIGTAVSIASDNYRGLVKDLFHWFRKPVKS